MGYSPWGHRVRHNLATNTSTDTDHLKILMGEIIHIIYSEVLIHEFKSFNFCFII